MEQLLFDSDPEAEAVLVRLLLDRIRQIPPTIPDAQLLPPASGVYLLYYVGHRHPVYGGMTDDVPLYVGKAVNQLAQLRDRIKDHCKSIRQTCDLDLADFRLRILQINEDWVAGCETRLIRHYAPLWNTVITGFGNHAPGRGRKDQKKSLWDTLHPGRLWAARLPIPEGIEDVEQRAIEWCRERSFVPAEWGVNVEEQFMWNE